MKVLGIDPGTAACGYGIVHASGGRLQAVEFGWWRTSARERPELRLKRIHDGIVELIDRHAPEAVVLEAILANLAEDLRVFADLLAHFHGGRADSETLSTGVRSIGRLAQEICGDCVPRQYTPELRVWMDRIHDLAGKLTNGPA